MCLAARAFPPPLGPAATRRGSSDRAPVRPSRTPRLRSPALTMSVALSNRFQGKRHRPTTLPRPRHAIPRASARVRCAPACHLCAPGGRRGLQRVQEAVADSGGARPGETPTSRAVSLSSLGGKAFGLLKARQERRLAEINRVSRHLRFCRPAARAACKSPEPRGAALSPKLPTPLGPTSSSPGLPPISSLRPFSCASDSR